MSEQMSEAARAARNEYRRKWRAANPDKVRATNARYWEKKAAAAAAAITEERMEATA